MPAVKKAYVLGFAVLLVFGAVKWRFEQNLADEHRQAFFHGEKLNLSLRQQIGQGGFIAALSGFRSLVADFLWIEAHAAWIDTRWERMALLFNNVTALEPRNVMFWDMAAWHMGWNASNDARDNTLKQPRLALRLKAQREYFELAEDFLKRGIQFNPDRYNLYEKLGILYRDKFQDHCKAWVYFDKAAQFKHVPTYLKRFAAYEMAQCPGMEQQAYDRLSKLYEMGEQERLPTLLKDLKLMEDKLNIPPADRVDKNEKNNNF